MKEQNLGKKCRYTDRCPYYQGREKMGEMDLTIMRNVFCYRGRKGWQNCPQYKIFSSA
jgi:hypothetical protein